MSAGHRRDCGLGGRPRGATRAGSRRRFTPDDGEKRSPSGLTSGAAEPWARTPERVKRGGPAGFSRARPPGGWRFGGAAPGARHAVSTVEQLLITLAVGAAVFAATNVDDLFVLLGFFADPAYRPRQVALGQLAGIGLLVAASVLCALVALVIPGPWLGLLGLAPLGIGLWKLRGLRRGRGDPAEHPRATGPRGAQAFAVMAVTVANGGDTLRSTRRCSPHEAQARWRSSSACSPP